MLLNANMKRRRLAATVAKVAAIWGERLNVHDPEFNLREIAKQLALLEEHLFHPGKLCPDCVRKHLLTVEALADETVSLVEDADSGLHFRELGRELSEQAKQWVERFNSGEPVEGIGEEVRKARKGLVKQVPDPRREIPE
jgi:hypothetical protein